jgi:hypothetical protein
LAAPFRGGGAARGSDKGGSAAFIPEGLGGPGGPEGALRGAGLTDGGPPTTGTEGALDIGGGGAVLGGVAVIGVAGLEGGTEPVGTGVALAPGGGGGGAFGASVAPAVLLIHRLRSLS